MCRLLYLHTTDPRDPAPLLERFAEICRDSDEYQGHGWGAAWWDGTAWQTRHSLTRIWQEADPGLPDVTQLLVHARSAFRDQGIVLENNMPFRHGGQVFAFNGELHGVRVRGSGRIGAEKIFNLHRPEAVDPAAEAARVRRILISRTRRIIGMNWILCDGHRTVFSSHTGERTDYYTLHRLTTADSALICSEPLDHDPGWQALWPGIQEVSLCTS